MARRIITTLPLVISIVLSHLNTVVFCFTTSVRPSTTSTKLPSSISISTTSASSSSNNRSKSRSSLYALLDDNDYSSSNTSSGRFELQELRAYMNAVQKADISNANIDPLKRLEIVSYVKGVAQKCDSPIALNEIGKAFLSASSSSSSVWRLEFSTSSTNIELLPKEARVFIKIYDYDDRTNSGKLDYVLKFTKRIFALKKLTAKSTFTLDVSDYLNPGLLTYQYQEITSDIFGLTLPTGLFGMLKGRVSYIDTVYFDGEFWIDRGYTPDGEEYYNVYIKQDDDEI